jgi:hypothetical protein
VEGLLLLIEAEVLTGRKYVDYMAVRKTITAESPSEHWRGAYSLSIVPAPELRKRLLELTKDGGPDDVAAKYLTMIDDFRAEIGIPESEPRHPDIASGKPWPIMSASVSAPSGGSITRLVGN